MSSAITFEMPIFAELLKEMKTMNRELSEMKALLSIEKNDEREFVTSGEFCTRHRISPKTLYKRVSENKIEVDDSLGIKRYRKKLGK